MQLHEPDGGFVAVGDGVSVAAGAGVLVAVGVTAMVAVSVAVGRGSLRMTIGR